MSLDSEFICPSFGESIFHGSVADFEKTLKNVKLSTGTTLEKLFWEIKYFDQSPPRFKILSLPSKSRDIGAVFEAPIIHGSCDLIT